MDYETLEKLLEGNQEAIEFVQSTQETVTSLSERVNNQERKIEDIIQSRDKVKQRLGLIKQKLGIEEVTEEALEKAMAIEPDEKVKAEIDNYKSEIDNLRKQQNEIQSKFAEEKAQMKIGNEILNSGVGSEAATPEAAELLSSLLIKGATVDDSGNVVYKNSDGTTMLKDGKPVSVKDRLNELRTNNGYAGLFKSLVTGGSGGPGSGKEASRNVDVSKMNPAQKAELITEIGQDAYLKLVQTSLSKSKNKEQ
jgi:hypothetical protein